MSDKINEIRARHSRENRWRYSPSPQMHDDRATLLAEVDRQRAEIERLHKALRWYADPRNHFPVERRSPGDPDPAVVFVEEPPIMSDCGKRARKALEGKT